MAVDPMNEIIRLFREFGYITCQARIPANPLGKKYDQARADLAEYEIDIKLQPYHLTRQFLSGRIVKDSEVREAMYEMAEDAILIAEHNFVLLAGPEIRIRGGRNDYIEGELMLHFRHHREYDRDNSGRDRMT